MNRLFKASCACGMTLLPAMAVDVPRPAPEFSVKMPKAAARNCSASTEGKVVALEFMFTTCPHCQHASQLMSRLQTEYGPKGFQAHRCGIQRHVADAG